MELLSSSHWVILFYYVYLKHLGLFEKTWGLCSILEGSPFDFRCLTFTEEALKFPADFLPLPLPRELLIFFYRLIHQSYWQYLILSPGCSFPTLSSGGLLQVIDHPKRFPVFLGLQKISEGLVCVYKQCPGKSSPWFLVFFIQQQRRSLWISSRLSCGLSLVDVFLIHFV